MIGAYRDRRLGLSSEPLPRADRAHRSYAPGGSPDRHRFAAAGEGPPEPTRAELAGETVGKPGIGAKIGLPLGRANCARGLWTRVNAGPKDAYQLAVNPSGLFIRRRSADSQRRFARDPDASRRSGCREAPGVVCGRDGHTCDGRPSLGRRLVFRGAIAAGARVAVGRARPGSIVVWDEVSTGDKRADGLSDVIARNLFSDATRVCSR